MLSISIIIPVYNVEDYVAECLESVMRQEVDCPIECLVIDDKGSDRSMSVVKETLARYKGPISFRIIEHETNGGLSAARNTGIREATGQYLYFLDSDDLITSDCIASLSARVKEHPGVQIVVGNFQTFPEPNLHRHLSLHAKNFPEFSDNVFWIRSIFLNAFPETAWNKLVQRNFLIKNNLFFKEGILHEDHHWQAVAYHYINSVAFMGKITYLYRMRSGSITNSEGVLQRRIDNLTLIYKDVLSRKITWDKSWDNWIFNLIQGYKYNRAWNEVRQSADRTWKIIALGSAKNTSCPYTLRLMYRLLTISKNCRWNKFIIAVHKMLNRCLPSSNVPLH